ncbi:tyrosine-protein phosphatase [Streptomyces cacaoi]|uniref:Phosphatase n=1 Tax=Streptomyces cacaoi TaxID=1898 RepID=A0A4Y3QQD3_STRCI|nr:tyrosine-protein phosphatase [Streptomyces cacaoi]NNG89750.1 tyrosine-protein phosphatase [Streptomyces cacaoi]GEB47495.1 phosphatase [Streptomyces cacaoi]
MPGARSGSEEPRHHESGPGPEVRTGTPLSALTVANVRDLGGIPLVHAGADRVVAPGLLLRSGALDRFDPAGDTGITGLGIRTVVDLRTDEERGAAPDVLPRGAGLVTADVLGAARRSAPARLGSLLADPAAAGRELGGGRVEEVFAAAYREMVLSPGACAAYRTLVEAAADERRRPLLFHCSAGKDRTGWGATVVLLLLGADRATARAAHLAVNPAVRAAFAPYVSAFTARGGDPRIAAAVTEVLPGYLAAALDAVDTEWGGFDRYVTRGLGLDRRTVDRLRTALVAPAP